jgi:hypothetical protein
LLEQIQTKDRAYNLKAFDKTSMRTWTSAINMAIGIMPSKPVTSRPARIIRSSDAVAIAAQMQARLASGDAAAAAAAARNRAATHS